MVVYPGPGTTGIFRMEKMMEREFYVLLEKDEDGRVTTVPIHAGQDIGRDF